LHEVEVSLDLGLTKTRLRLSGEGFYLDGRLIHVGRLHRKDDSCYVVVDGVLRKVQFFSEESKTLYKLVPTSYRPILQFSGTSMHKMPFVERVRGDRLCGRVLDAGTGLGYTAIAAAESADEVITVEADKTVVEIAKLNPYSRDLFGKGNITLVVGDVVDEIKKFGDSCFDCIIFDAGTPKSSGEFFSLGNYGQAYRVLKRGGRLYHYLPRHHVKHERDFGAEVLKRIREAGFTKTERNVSGSYVVSRKL
jgi:predicted methyltransferase